LFLFSILLSLFLGKINILKITSTLHIWLKVPPSGGRCRVVIPSLRVIDSRIENLVFRRLVLSLWFSIVFQNNYGGDSQISFFKTRFLFLVRRPVAITVTTHTFSHLSLNHTPFLPFSYRFILPSFFLALST